jgi:hypothetical protein
VVSLGDAARAFERAETVDDALFRRPCSGTPPASTVLSITSQDG